MSVSRVRPVVIVVLLMLLGLLATLAPTRVGAADFTVSTCDETHFRTALSNAQMSNGNRVLFACDGTITIDHTVTLDGNGHAVTLDGGNAVQLFFVFSGTFTVQGLTLSQDYPPAAVLSLLARSRTSARSTSWTARSAAIPPMPTLV